ncbi:translation initiation factor IF-2 [Desulforegula conservatrix]|uniref:translation initiation factor IF-2 n=1 Tax=Desulforegula conservatrix TaxID=153026 RepID=UPI000411FAA1|nr:translation initiation factor IF-2 [Desulforegula conservatrix]
MAKIRVYELAKELGMSHKALLDKIMQLDIDVRSHMSSLEDDAVKLIKEQVAGKKAEDDDKNKPTVIRRRKANAETPELNQETAAKAEDSLAEAAVEESFEAHAEISETDMIAEPDDHEAEQTQSEKIESDLPGNTFAEKQDGHQPRKKDASGKHSAAKVIFRPELLEQPEEVMKQSTKENKTPAQEHKQAEHHKKRETRPVHETETVSVQRPSEPENVKTVIAEIIAEEDKKAEPPFIPGSETPRQDKQGAPAKPMDTSVKPETDDSGEEDKGSSKSKKKGKKPTAARIIKLPDFIPEITPKKTFKPERRPVVVDVPIIEPEEKVIAPVVNAEPSDDKAKKRHGGGGGDSWDKKGKKKTFSKKEVVEGNALYSESGRFGKKKKGGKAKPEPQKTQLTVPKAIKRRIKVDETIILAELAKRMGIKANEMIAKLMELGVMATVNQTIDYDTAVLVASEFSFEVEKASFEEDTLIAQEVDAPESLITRAPVVTIMGHVDHGKTSLLDVIRKTKVANFEAGGITQHIGAYSVTTDRGMITFLDTPGHEAFTSMRSRGAKITDLVILVVAADDGVMPQTIEAINHAKAAGVPIIVAVNKIDKPDADPDRVKRELSDHGVLAEDWGGDVIFVHVSAKQAINIDALLEMILLQAEFLDLKANPEKMARGHVIEAKLDSGRGPVATVLIQEGTLKPGKYIVCGIQYGRVRAMINDKGQKADEAGPSIPVEVLGLSGVPMAGDEIIECKSEKDARQISQDRAQKQRAKELAKNSRMSLEGLFEKLEEGIVKDLNLILKADVHGSIEALKESLSKLSTSEVKINVIHSATGTVTESDVSLAAVSNAIILGFNVRPGAKVHEMAEEENVDMRFYNIIYDAIKDIKNAMIGLMDSTYEERVMGRAEVVEAFSIPKVGTIAGVMVSNGKIQRNLKARVLRNGIIVYDGNISSLRRFKDDVKEVAQGYDCGIGIENFNDIKIGDTIECYYMEEIKPKMDE